MKIQRKNKISKEFSMASMTDIVFLLLIFYMLTSNFVTQNALDVKLPKSEGNPSPEEPITVTILPKGIYYVNEDIVPEMELENRLLNVLAQNKTNSFILRADQNALHKEVVKVLSIANRNQLKMVIATEPPANE